MKSPSLIAATGLSLLCGLVARGADATAPVDYTQRNTAFAPAATVVPAKKDLPRDAAVQDQRVDKTVRAKTPAAVGDRRAPINVDEARAKSVREKTSSRPEALAEPMSAFNHREAAITTAADTKRPPLVAKYQDSLTAASASNMARFPAMSQATTARINRFVFRKNAPDSSSVTGGAPVTPAAGGSPIRK